MNTGAFEFRDDFDIVLYVLIQKTLPDQQTANASLPLSKEKSTCLWEGKPLGRAYKKRMCLFN